MASLYRDVERMLSVLAWFEEKKDAIHPKLKARLFPADMSDDDSDVEGHLDEDISDFVLSCVLALGVAYYVRLEERFHFLETIFAHFRGFGIHSEDGLHLIISACQDLFADELTLEDTIFKNEALKENVW